MVQNAEMLPLQTNRKQVQLNLNIKVGSQYRSTALTSHSDWEKLAISG